jgi:hypothetical protein
MVFVEAVALLANLDRLLPCNQVPRSTFGLMTFHSLLLYRESNSGAEGEQLLGRSDAGILIVQEVFGFVKKKPIRCVAEDECRWRERGADSPPFLKRFEIALPGQQIDKQRSLGSRNGSRRRTMGASPLRPQDLTLWRKQFAHRRLTPPACPQLRRRSGCIPAEPYFPRSCLECNADCS